MDENGSVRIYIPKDMEVAELIEWGYATSGDFDEALRVYILDEYLAGYTLEYTETELARAREDFEHNFSKET